MINVSEFIGYLSISAKLKAWWRVSEDTNEEMNKHAYSFSLFVSSKTRYHAEFQYIESDLFSKVVIQKLKTSFNTIKPVFSV